MQNIANPKKIHFTTGSNPNEGVITIEPLFPGYGMTLGNSLRRVLLSSLPGAAVVSVKIKGASHEFMAIPGIKEDVLEMVLNFKQLRFKMFNDEEVRLELKVKGKKTVTAADITKNSELEIKNPSLVLAHITDDSASLEVEILVRSGRGYRMTEGNKRENKEVGFIEVDSVFSPVTLVSINVESARVGKMTNWDRLILNIKTDGTITPEEAFDESVKILVEQFSTLLPDGAARKEEESAVINDVSESEDDIENLTADNEDDINDEESDVEGKKVKKEKKEKKEKKSKKII